MSPEQFKKFMDDQVEEIMKYKWCLGEQIYHDPLNDISIDELFGNWIVKHSAEFRKCWEASSSCKI